MKKIIKLYNRIAINFRDKQPPTPLNKVLVVSNTALGDTILSTPAIKTLRENFPNIYIEFLIHKNIYPLFKDFDLVDKITIYNKKLWWLIKFSNYLKRNNFDTIFFLHSNGPQDLFIALKSKVNNILKAINYPDQVSQEFNKIILNNIDYSNKKHIIEHRLDLIKFFNLEKIFTQLFVPYTPKVKNNTNFIIGLQIGTQDLYKIWRADKYIELLNKIYKLYPSIVLTFFGIEEEKLLTQQIINNIESKNIIDLCGKTNLENLSKELSKINLLLTPDTGTMHLAIALKIPTISLFSPTDAKIFGPYQDLDRHIIIQKNGSFINDKPKKLRNQKAMDLITVEEVLNAIRQQIGNIKCVA